MFDVWPRPNVKYMKWIIFGTADKDMKVIMNEQPYQWHRHLWASTGSWIRVSKLSSCALLRAIQSFVLLQQIIFNFAWTSDLTSTLYKSDLCLDIRRKLLRLRAQSVFPAKQPLNKVFLTLFKLITQQILLSQLKLHTTNSISAQRYSAGFAPIVHTIRLILPLEWRSRDVIWRYLGIRDFRSL